MTPEKHQRVEFLFEKALELTGAERAAFLESINAREPTVGRELLSLLEAHQQAESFIETPALVRVAPTILRHLAGAPPVPDPSAGPLREPVPQQGLGPYRLLKRLGRGGMGVVYRAEHIETGRQVAIKTVQTPARETLSSLRREIHALARIRHPGIVAIVDEGVDQQGLPWYAMELIEGPTLRQFAQTIFQRPPSSPALPRASSALESRPPTPWWTHSLSSLGSAQGESVGSVELEALAPEAQECAAALPEPYRAGLHRILGVIRQLCSSLAFLHGEGLVHRDLKPENILVVGHRPAAGCPGEAGSKSLDTFSKAEVCLSDPAAPSADVPVLIDFGLAVQFSADLSRDSLFSESLAGGTLSYIAPEQSRGEPVDARADLYALGCILYELLTGRPPFLGESPAAVLRQHFQAPVIPPSQVSALLRACPEAPLLDELVLRLLEKQPRNRPGHADDVAAWLAKLVADPSLSVAGPKARAYLYRPGFSGRVEPLAQLEARLRVLGSGPGSLILIGGESGVGKTRLAIEATRTARVLGVSVVLAECAPGGTGALQALRPLLRHVVDQCHEQGPAETRRLLGSRASVLSRYEPALGQLPGLEPQPAVEEMPAVPARQRLNRFLAETLEALTGGENRTAPLLLILDDLQWSDELSLLFLEHLLRSDILRRTHVLVLATYRTEEVGFRDDGPLHRLLSSPAATRLELGRLAEKEIGSIVADMLGVEPVRGPFSSFLAQQSEGNPFFVAEYLRAAVAEGLLYRDDRGRWQMPAEASPAPDAGQAEAGPPLDRTFASYQALPLPRSLRQLIGRRIDGLSPAAQGLLQATAVLGRDLEATELEAIAGFEEQQQRAALSELLARQVLEEPAAGRLRFAHDKLREAAYERLDAAQRQRLHRAAAEAIGKAQATAQVPIHSQAARLAHHWEQAGAPLEARPYYLAAAKTASEQFTYAEAELYFKAYLRLAEPDGAERIRAQSDLGRVLLQRGRPAESLAAHEQALADARRSGERALEADGLVAIGRLLWSTGQVDEAQSLLQQSLVVCRDAADRKMEAQALSNLAILAQERGRLEEARKLYEQVIQLMNEDQDHRNIARQLGNLAIVYHNLGQREQADRLYREAVELHRQYGDRLFEGVVLGNLANVTAESGQGQEAEALYLQALQIHREIGNLRHEAIVLGNFANNVVYRQWRIEEARQLFQQALQLHREVGNQRHGGNVLGSLAILENLAAEDADKAEAFASQGVEMLGAVGDPVELGKLLGHWGHIALARGSSAQDFLTRALSLADSAGVGPESPMRRNLAALQQAQAAFEAGESHRLFRGHLPELLPEEALRWLAHTGRLPADQPASSPSHSRSDA